MNIINERQKLGHTEHMGNEKHNKTSVGVTDSSIY